MNWLWSIVIFGGAAAALLLVVVALSRHKKSATSDIHLIGARALVDSELAPEGAVLVDGELWRARSGDGSNIASQTIVKVVGVSGHLLLVESLNRDHSP